jgi:hypothetical protein
MVSNPLAGASVLTASSSHRRGGTIMPVKSSRDSALCDHPSIDEWIVGTLQLRGSFTIEQMAAPLGQVNWSEFFLAIDRLSREGQILLWPSAAGDVILSLKAH